jgi:succinyl-CoA:acetate CoA-transferase
MMTADIRARIRNDRLESKITSANVAAELIRDGMTVGISGFTPSGYPKDVPLALARRVKARGKPFHVNLYTGASTGPEVDGAWTEAGIIARRLPYHTNASVREGINSGYIEYVDMHLSQSTQYVNYGFIPKVDVAIIEALAITEDGNIVPTTAIGNTPAFVRQADKVIVEINLLSRPELEGMADIYTTKNPPLREPIPIMHPADRIGKPYIECGPRKIAAIVLTEKRDSTRPLAAAGEAEKRISANIIGFLANEVASGRLTNELLPLQSGVGSAANAVFYGLCESNFKNLTCYTEVIQDSMLDLLRTGKAVFASTTAISPSPEGLLQFEKDIDFFRDRIVLRPQEISNNPEVIRRIGVIAMNTAVEVDIYGNVNSTHALGTNMINGIGGSGDFARNGFISIFSTASTAKGGAISSIVPMVSHVDHTEHDVMAVVTEQGCADLRGLSPRERALKIIGNCAHPDYREALYDYYGRALAAGLGHTPHTLEESLSWHSKFLKTGSMK